MMMFAMRVACFVGMSLALGLTWWRAMVFTILLSFLLLLEVKDHLEADHGDDGEDH